MSTTAIHTDAAPLARKFRLTPGLFFLIILVVILAASLSMLMPLTVAPSSAAPTVFSAERALAHLPAIAGEPHPAGSAAQRQVRDYLVTPLSANGLSADIQTFGAFANIAARLPGSDSSGAMVILAHYDSAANSPGAADNGSGVAAVLEVARALKAGPPVRNDIIFLFDDAEEGMEGVRLPFAGSRAFARQHPWMADVRMVISLDTAVAGPIQVNDTTSPNGRLVQALADVHRRGWAWASFGGGGTYDNSPFKELGIQSMALEDNHAFRVQHTQFDQVEIIRPASLQQLGDQTLAIARHLGMLDLREPWGSDELFVYVPLLGLFHYPAAWALPLAVLGGVVLLAAIFFTLRGRVAGVRGLAAAVAAGIGAAGLSGLVVGAILSQLPSLLGWQVQEWPEWPEIVPPQAGWILTGAMLITVGAAYGLYRVARRWSNPAEMALAALIPFALLALALAVADVGLSVLPLWPTMLGALAWLAFVLIPRARQRMWYWPTWIAAGLLALHWPSIIVTSFLSSGPSDLGLLMALWALVMFSWLPAIESAGVNLLPRTTVHQAV